MSRDLALFIPRSQVPSEVPDTYLALHLLNEFIEFMVRQVTLPGAQV